MWSMRWTGPNPEKSPREEWDTDHYEADWLDLLSNWSSVDVLRMAKVEIEVRIERQESTRWSLGQSIQLPRSKEWRIPSMCLCHWRSATEEENLWPNLEWRIIFCFDIFSLSTDPMDWPSNRSPWRCLVETAQTNGQRTRRWSSRRTAQQWQERSVQSTGLHSLDSDESTKELEWRHRDWGLSQWSWSLASIVCEITRWTEWCPERRGREKQWPKHSLVLSWCCKTQQFVLRSEQKWYYWWHCRR